MSYDTYTKAIKESIEPLTTEFKTDNLAILKFHSFENGYNEADRKIAEKKLDVFFNRLDSLKTENLIIDLRDNGGGSAEIANYLFSYLTNKSYYYFDYVGVKYNTTKKWKHYAQYPNNIEEIVITETKRKMDCIVIQKPMQRTIGGLKSSKINPIIIKEISKF